MKILTIKTEKEKTIIETNKGNITLRKFGCDYISQRDVPYGFSKESELYLKIKRCLISGEDLSQFIGCSFAQKQLKNEHI